MTRYDRHRQRSADRQREISREGREIGPLPKVKDPKRRKRLRGDLEAALRTYFPNRFPLKFSADHKEVISAAQLALTRPHLQAIAMPRGYGKTTICEAVVILAVLFGFHRYVALIAATNDFAKRRLESIRKEFETNDLLLADFPEVCLPIRSLDGIVQKCRGQLLNGQPTSMKIEPRRIVLPTVPDSEASGSVIEAAGLLSAVRGMNYTNDDGEIIRPTFSMIDDPQTRRSAKSELQSKDRAELIAGDVLYLPGPGKKISAVMPMTVIKPGDLAERMLDHEKFGQWSGICRPMLYSLPTNLELWDQYGEIYLEDLRDRRGTERANAFYRRRRKKMDAGAVASWPQKFNDDETSAIENAMRLYYDGPDAFWAECQNDPSGGEADANEFLTSDQVALKMATQARRQIPEHHTKITAFIDVQKQSLWWLVASWSDRFGGLVADYGVWPAQAGNYFKSTTLRKTLATAYPGRSLDARILQALLDCSEHLFGLQWQRDDGAQLQIDRLLVDANWGESTDTVYNFCRHALRNRWPVYAYHGTYVGAKNTPWNMRKIPAKKMGRKGDHWRMPPVVKRKVQYVLSDVNWWKTFVQQRLAVPIGDPTSLELFHAARKTQHRMLAEHLTAEQRLVITGPYGDADEWSLLPGRDNHLLDGLVGSAVAASIEGCRLDALRPPPAKRKTKRKRVQSLNC